MPNWWMYNVDAKSKQGELARTGEIVELRRHGQQKGVYGKKLMTWLRPADASYTQDYLFDPKVQHDFELKLVYFYESIEPHLDADGGRALPPRIDGDALGVLLPAARDLATLTAKHGGADVPTDARSLIVYLQHLKTHKRLYLMEEHAAQCGVAGGAVAVATPPAILRVVLLLPPPARGRWYSQASLLEELKRRGLCADHGAQVLLVEADLDILFSAAGYVHLRGRSMPRRSAGGTTHLYLSRDGEDVPTSLSEQLHQRDAAAPLCDNDNASLTALPNEARRIWDAELQARGAPIQQGTISSR